MLFGSIFGNLCLGILAVPLGVVFGIAFLKSKRNPYYPCSTVQEGFVIGAVAGGALLFLGLFALLIANANDEKGNWIMTLLAFVLSFAGLTVIVACPLSAKAWKPDSDGGKEVETGPVPPPPTR